MHDITVFLADAAAVSEASLEILRTRLSPQENTLAGHLAHDGRRREFVVGRVLVRTLLGKLAQCDPSLVPLILEPGGKPALDPRSGILAPFNLSHSEGLVAVALGSDGSVGVDVLVSPTARQDVEPALRRYLSADEAAWVFGAPPQARWNRFLAVFCQKEALLKRSGKGLAGGLSQTPVQLSLGPFQTETTFFSALPLSGRQGFLAVSSEMPVERWTVQMWNWS